MVFKLQLSVGVPKWMVEVCKEKVKSGAFLVNLSDGEMERELGLRNPLHRLKLSLAVQSMLKAQSGQVLPHPMISPKESGVDHKWVSYSWIPTLGLQQYAVSCQDVVSGASASLPTDCP